MSIQSEPPSRRGATAEQLRGDIDAGRTGDKVGGLDPAAAPLGTDEEAAGVTLDAETLAEVRAQALANARRPSTRENSATPELTPDGCGVRTSYAWPIAAGVLAAGVLAGAVLLLL
jgi:hypothetical protein